MPKNDGALRRQRQYEEGLKKRGLSRMVLWVPEDPQFREQIRKYVKRKMKEAGHA